MPTPRFPPYTEKTMFPTPGTEGNFMVLAKQWVTRPKILGSTRRYKGAPILSQETTELEPLWIECCWVKEKGYHVLRHAGLPQTKVDLRNVLGWMKLPDKSPDD